MKHEAPPLFLHLLTSRTVHGGGGGPGEGEAV